MTTLIDEIGSASRTIVYNDSPWCRRPASVFAIGAAFRSFFWSAGQRVTLSEDNESILPRVILARMKCGDLGAEVNY